MTALAGRIAVKTGPRLQIPQPQDAIGTKGGTGLRGLSRNIRQTFRNKIQQFGTHRNGESP